MKIVILFLGIFILSTSGNAQVKLYGLTFTGGNNDNGVIFEWMPSTNTYTKKIDFDFNTIGASPQGALAQKGDKFYGMTNSGGLYTYGVIFEWDPIANIYTRKIDFNGTNGGNPQGTLTLTGNKFYGLTSAGGANGGGVIFEWDPVANIYAKKIDLNVSNGYSGVGSLTFYNGKFYGMTSGGGASLSGVIFEWDPTNNIYTKKIDFSVANGQNPFGNLTLHNGKFYGMTFGGGANFGGVIFEWDPVTNIYSKKIDLTAATGISPWGSLFFNNNKFYGMTFQGGVNSMGVIFEWDPVSNIYTSKIDFDGINGSRPVYTTLTMYAGLLYGVTGMGGLNGTGVIFEWDPITNIYNKRIDCMGSNGDHPYGSLVAFDNTVLAVQLLSFSASVQNNNNARLQWQIAKTEEGAIYELQRSSDSRTFSNIDQQTGNTSRTQFSYTDNALPVGAYYYRLKITDRDGKITYSNIAIIKVGNKEQPISVYPSPVKRGESLQVNLQNITANNIQIINSTGQLIYSSLTTQSGSLIIPVSLSWAPGQHLIKVVSSDKVDVRKILVW